MLSLLHSPNRSSCHHPTLSSSHRPILQAMFPSPILHPNGEFRTFCPLLESVHITNSEVHHGKLSQIQSSSLLLSIQRSWSVSTTNLVFERTSKRRKGYPSETRVKKGRRVVHGDKELAEKLGRRDLCPCGSGRTYKNCCLKSGRYDGSLRDYYFQRLRPKQGLVLVRVPAS